jgi:hypothetical protein
MTLGELLIAAAISMTLMGTVLGVLRPLQQVFDTQPEYADTHQRMRAAIDAMSRDLLGAASPVMPYRSGLRRHDPDAGVFYRPDTITLVSQPWDSSSSSQTYYLKADAETGMSQLMRYDGGESDLPLADHVVGLSFAYFDAAGAELADGELQDGPWFPDAVDRHRFDVDLLRIRRVRVTLRARTAQPALQGLLPDAEIGFDVTPRNLNRE